MGINLCPYPNFEGGATGWTGWHDYPGSDLFPCTPLTSEVETGATTGARYISSNTDPGTYAYLDSSFIAITPGVYYVLSFYYRGLLYSGQELFLEAWPHVAYWNAAQTNAISNVSLENYKPTLNWQRYVSSVFAAPEGMGIAYAKIGIYFKHWAGNSIEVTSVKFELAPVSAFGEEDPVWFSSLVINDDDASTDDNDVTLTIHAEDQNGDPPDEMRLAEAPVGTDPGDVVWGAWEPYATTRAWQLAAQTDEAAHDIGVGVEFQRT